MRSLCLLAVILIFAHGPAFGYVDPGTGHLVWQLALAAVLGGFYSIRRLIFDPLTRLIRRKHS